MRCSIANKVWRKMGCWSSRSMKMIRKVIICGIIMKREIVWNEKPGLRGDPLLIGAKTSSELEAVKGKVPVAGTTVILAHLNCSFAKGKIVGVVMIKSEINASSDGRVRVHTREPNWKKWIYASSDDRVRVHAREPSNITRKKNEKVS